MNNKIKTIAITSGKGGVGKSNLALCLAQALSQKQKRVTVLDADFSLANLHLLIGEKSEKNIADVLSQRCSIKDIIINTPEYVKLIPGARGVPLLSSPSSQIILGLIQAVDALADSTDILLVDTPSNMSCGELQLISACNEVIMVVTPTLVSIHDAVTFMLQLNKRHKVTNFNIVVNMAKSTRESHKVFEAIQKQIGFEHNAILRLLPFLPFDFSVKQANDQLVTVFKGYPSTKIAKNIGQISQIISEWDKSTSNGKLEFFLEHNLTA